ncbi:hypothetical protein RFI_27876 [Reticulomyxa filosa]|uniref:Uncharacterized protein n=1 Tax=Reticulomyxa filosa TaxID=46433 RepID=X6M900_RETFI|nr:hypothetical protein RFI_27876 [Reticulomyxa filosa]|eukprot:ETO09500.1 hypothetical protein RFI_27876 [Reticulomyxa filosa]
MHVRTYMLGLDTQYLQQYYGGFEMMYTVYNFSNLFATPLTSKQSNGTSKFGLRDGTPNYSTGFSMQSYIINKTPTRIPETVWMLFNAGIESCSGGYRVSKLGELIDVQKVMNNGTKHLHSENQFTGCFNQSVGDNVPLIMFQSLDAPLTAFVGFNNSYDNFIPFPIPLDVDNDLRFGFAYSLVNNIWGVVSYFVFFLIAYTHTKKRIALVFAKELSLVVSL